MVQLRFFRSNKGLIYSDKGPERLLLRPGEGRCCPHVVAHNYSFPPCFIDLQSKQLFLFVV